MIRGHRPSVVELFNSGEGKWVNEEYEFKIQYAATRATPQKLNAIAKKHGFSTYGDIGRAVRRLQTAGYIICAMFSGLRDSELGSLQVGCHQVREGLDGEVADWIYGRTFKLEESSKEVRWLVPPCVGKAVAVLEKISIYHRECLQHQLRYLQSMPSNELPDLRIHELKRWSNSLFLTKSTGSRYTYKILDNMGTNTRLQKFMVEENITDTDGQLWQLRSHQFRRTFAVFVAKNLIGDLRYLRHHFKHWSMDMTLHYARHDRSDESLISEIMNERDQITRIIASDWLTEDKPLLGGRGKAISAFKKRHDVKTEQDIKSSLGAIADGLFIRATGHSWCMSNAESCGGEGLYDQIQCVSCDNAVIDKSLVPAWEGIKEQESISDADTSLCSWITKDTVKHLNSCVGAFKVLLNNAKARLNAPDIDCEPLLRALKLSASVDENSEYLDIDNPESFKKYFPWLSQHFTLNEMDNWHYECATASGAMRKTCGYINASQSQMIGHLTYQIVTGNSCTTETETDIGSVLAALVVQDCEIDAIKLSSVAAELSSKYEELNKALGMMGKLSSEVFGLMEPQEVIASGRQRITLRDMRRFGSITIKATQSMEDFTSS